ncbi:MAG: Flp pilus assembly protein CpaB [Planctomycetes bacterium]|nr:Flp pilus assembly protein CpaB [Planctomycetota bacterium]
MRNKIALVMAIIMGVVAVVAMKLYLEQQRDKIRAEQVQYPVLEAAEDLKSGDLLGPTSVRVTKYPKTWIDALGGAVIEEAYKDNYVGKRKLVADVKEGKVLLVHHFALGAEGPRGGFTLGAGQRAVTVQVSETSGLAGALKVGDFVDVLATFKVQRLNYEFTVTLAEKKLVLSLGQAGAASPTGLFGGGGPASAYGTVTLKASPEEAQKLIHAQTFGSLSLVLREAADSQLDPKRPSFDSNDAIRQAIENKEIFNPLEHLQPGR